MKYESKLIRLISTFLEIIQVPISLGMFPDHLVRNYSAIKNELKLFGWLNSDDFYIAICNYVHPEIG